MKSNSYICTVLFLPKSEYHLFEPFSNHIVHVGAGSHFYGTHLAFLKKAELGTSYS